MFVKLAKKVNNIYSKFMPASRQKIFCIGMNKTGTTSLETAFTDLGYKLGNQFLQNGPGIPGFSIQLSGYLSPSG